MGFTGVCLITKDVNRQRTFYQEVLGLKAVAESKDYIRFDIGDRCLAVFQDTEMEKMAPGSTHGIGYGGCIIEITVDDVDAQYQRIKDKQGIVKPPTTQTWGIRSVWIKDPDGNIINFHQRVG